MGAASPEAALGGRATEIFSSCARAGGAYAVRVMTPKSSLSHEAVLAVLAGLAISGCEKKPAEATAEPPASAAPAAVSATPSAPAAAVSAKEVPTAPASAEKAGGCAPGGCAPGQCGGNKK
jgi:hypothetical protein